jgi:hypothetical protein
LWGLSYGLIVEYLSRDCIPDIYELVDQTQGFFHCILKFVLVVFVNELRLCCDAQIGQPVQNRFQL